MSDAATPFDSGRPRPIVTTLDTLRHRIDLDDFDVAVFALDAVAVDLGYGDVRALPGAVAWIDRLREEGKRVAVATGVERAEAALESTRLADRIDLVVTGSRPAERIARVLDELGVPADRAVVVSVYPDDLEVARAAGVELAIGLARGEAPERLRRAGALTVVADLSELVGADR